MDVEVEVDLMETEVALAEICVVTKVVLVENVPETEVMEDSKVEIVKEVLEDATTALPEVAADSIEDVGGEEEVLPRTSLLQWTANLTSPPFSR